MNELASLRRALCVAVSTLVTCACSSDNAKSGVDGGADNGAEAGSPAKPGFSASAVAELKASHVDKYMGKASLSDTTKNADGDTVYNFDKNDGPECLLGDQYHAIVHDAGSENLLIFLQGGGACWETLCAATMTAETTMIKSGILDRKNPSVGDWNIVYAPYCDGSVFSGDNDMMSPDGTQNWHFHGLANVSAALDAAKKAFPHPKRIVLAGTSGGGYGTLTGTAIVRLAYPDTQLDVFNDAGLGLSNLMDPNMLATVKRDWKFDQFLPASCSECAAVQTALIGWGLAADPTLRVSGFSSYGDMTIGGYFLKLGPADFKQLLLEQTNKVHDKFPKRFERFFINGEQHTVLLGALSAGGVGFDTPVDGLSVDDFLGKMLAGDPGWVDHLQSGDGG